MVISGRNVLPHNVMLTNPFQGFSAKSHVQCKRISLFEHRVCCLKMASSLFDNSFKQLYTYIFMQEFHFEVLFQLPFKI